MCVVWTLSKSADKLALGIMCPTPYLHSVLLLDEQHNSYNHAVALIAFVSQFVGYDDDTNYD